MPSVQRQSSPIRSVLSFFTRPKPFAYDEPENGSAYSLHPMKPTTDETSNHSTPMNSPTTSSTTDTLLALSRQTAHLQNTLQNLLDAQSNGLLAGLGRPPTSSKRSKTQYGRSPSSRTASPRAQLRKEEDTKNLSLQNARVQIHSTLLSLSEIKFTESRLLASQVSSRSDFLASLEALKDKKSNLEAEISSIETGEGGYDSINKLESEEKDLTVKIEELETTLAELKARLLHVKRRKDEDKNRIEARLSSWKGALNEVESQLSGPILDGRGFDGSVISTLKLHSPNTINPEEARVNVWDLPRARRTIEMLEDSVEFDRSFLSSQQEAAETESTACTEGAEIWKTVVRSVRKVEKRVASELSSGVSSPQTKQYKLLSPSFPPPSSHLLDPKSRTASFGSTTTTSSTDATTNFEDKSMEERAKAILDLMDTTAQSLEKYLRTAEDKNWRLLVVTIGSELEALIEAKEMLERVVLPETYTTAPTTTYTTASNTLTSSEVKGGTTLQDTVLHDTILRDTILQDEDLEKSASANLMISGVLLKGKEKEKRNSQPLIDLSRNGNENARGREGSGFEDDGPPLDLLTSVD